MFVRLFFIVLVRFLGIRLVFIGFEFVLIKF